MATILSLSQCVKMIYKPGQGQIFFTLAALMYEPYLMLSANQKLCLFHVLSPDFISLLTTLYRRVTRKYTYE